MVIAKEKSLLDTKFKHHKWFLEGKTKREALDYFASCPDFYLDKKEKRSKRMEVNLFAEPEYDYVLRYSSRKDRSTYKMTPEEIDFYLERKQYHDEKREQERQAELLRLETEPLNIFATYKKVYTHFHYDIRSAKSEIKSFTKHNDNEGIKYWTKELERAYKRFDIGNKFFMEQLKKGKLQVINDYERFQEDMYNLFVDLELKERY